jgi:hypothetical protein
VALHRGLRKQKIKSRASPAQLARLASTKAEHLSAANPTPLPTTHRPVFNMPTAYDEKGNIAEVEDRVSDLCQAVS